MVESDFLSILQAFLGGLSLSPEPQSLGVAEPIAADSLPAVVLSLESTRRPSPGVGERAQLIEDGALPWQAEIDLAHPFLPDDESFSLLSESRLLLDLPHGGLVQKEGAEGALGADDFSLRVDGILRPIVAANPAGLEIQVDARMGRVTFGTPLPESGKVEVTYVLGQWERRVARLSGVLRVDVCAGDADDARSLSDSVFAALSGDGVPAGSAGLFNLNLTSLGSIGGPELAFASCRRRSARFTFDFEQNIDRPDSSGGIIREIPIKASPV